MLSKDELNAMYTNLYKKGLGSFSGDWYWSSSEYKPEYIRKAWVKRFIDDWTYADDKSHPWIVRAVRYF